MKINLMIVFTEILHTVNGAPSKERLPFYNVHCNARYFCTHFKALYENPKIKARHLQGGLKAVVWADVLQAIVMAAGMIAIVVQGAINVGGFVNIFTINAENERMHLFNFNIDPWQRYVLKSFWCLHVSFDKIKHLN